MNLLLAADIHLTDVAIEEYRWTIFDHLLEKALAHKVKHIYLLGDILDRKDRHTGKLVNRLVQVLHDIKKRTECLISILAGNHDAPIEGGYYWEFLNEYADIHYITQPEFHHDCIWVLPFSSNPVKHWAEIPFEKAKAILMHQPVQGAFIDEYRTLTKAPVLPILPKIPIFSGDIHNPQILNNIIYIGVPHPVHFNENWKNRIILVNSDNFKAYKEICLPSIKRSLIEISSVDELDQSKYKEGDQLRIRYQLDGLSLATWPSEQEKIKKWCIDRKVFLTSLDPFIVGDSVQKDNIKQFEMATPDQVLRDYAKQEKLSDEVIDIGLSLLSV